MSTTLHRRARIVAAVATAVVTVNLAGYGASQGAGERPGFVGISGWSEALFEAVADAVRPA